MQKILLLPLLFLNLQTISAAATVTLNSSLGATTSVNQKYSVKDRADTYIIPNATIQKTYHFSKSTNLILNGDFEAGTANWPYISGSGFVTDYQSGANHPGQYLWGRSTSGFQVHQLRDITFYPNVKYVECLADYGGWANRDTVRILTKYKDAAGVDSGVTDQSPFFTGLRGDLFKTLSYTKSVPANTAKVDFILEEKRQSGSDSDGYLDNIRLHVWPDTFESNTSGFNDHMYSVKFTLPVLYLSNSGNDIIEPSNREDYYENATYKGGLGNDYLIMPKGDLNIAYGEDGDDVIVSYLGADVSTQSRIYGGNGDDKIYAPLNGAGHLIKGEAGYDTLVLRGLKTDYTFNYIIGDRYDITHANGLNIRSYSIEAYSFTSDNPLTAPNGSTYSTEDLWTVDIATNTITEVFPAYYNSYFKSVQLDKKAITIVHDSTTNFDFYLTNLPNSIIRVEDTSGNTLIDAITVTNGDSEIKTTAKLLGIGNVDVNAVLVSERNLIDITPDDFSLIRLTQGFLQ